MDAIDVATGRLLDLPGSVAAITAAARKFTPTTEFEIQEPDELKEFSDANKGHLGPGSSVKPKDLSTAGWGIVFRTGESAAVIEALRPLMDWRKLQAGALYKEYIGANGYAGQTKKKFLGTADGFGVVEPARNGVPYYLLLVGSPNQIPFTFQYLLDVQYAVGRIHFDTPAEYRLYAENVVAAEKGNLTLPRKAAFYGTANKNDSSTAGSNKKLIEPMKLFTAELLTTQDRDVEPPTKWDIFPEPDVITKAEMIKLLSDAPALVMMAAHGAKLPLADFEGQRAFNGALLSEDFEFPAGNEKKPVPLDAFLTAKDVPPDARLHGSIFLIFACYGGGTPQFEDFIDAGSDRRQLAQESFLAALPKRLLTGGVLAVVAHVERAWATSFEGEQATTGQLQTFINMWQPLMEGFPIGFAMESFNSKYAELATVLTDAIFSDGINPNKKPDSPFLRKLWEAMHDARNFCVIGDPAVRLRVSSTPSGPVEIPRTPVTTSDSAAPQPLAPVQPKPSPVIESAQALFDTAPKPAPEPNLDAMTQRLSALLQTLVGGLNTTEVTTYISDTPASAKIDPAGAVTGATLCARTHIGIDGKTINIVPAPNGQVDSALWSIHTASVDKAIANRLELTRIAATTLLTTPRK